MTNWDTLEADVNRILDRHFTAGRDGNNIEFIVLHYNAGNLSIDGIWNVWQTREASAHYQVTQDGTVGQLVWDADTAWHAGNYNINTRSIGIEHANDGNGNLFPATLDNGAHLVAALCHYYGLGRPQYGENVFYHCDFYATACPGGLKNNQADEYFSRAGQWYDQMAGEGSAPSPAQDYTPATPSPSDDIDQMARDVIAGFYGNGDARRAALGANYDAVQARVNEILGFGDDGDGVDDDDYIDELARDVIAGFYGNGEDRRAALGSYYDAVQARVNEILEG